MKFEYPVKSSSGEVPHHLTAGYYPIGASNTWHGGVHIEGEQRRIQNIADGEIIAYKISSEYIEDKKKAVGDSKKDIVTYYSDSFVLIRHKYKYGEDKTFTFYSLYCHLQIEREITDEKYPIFAKRHFEIKSDAKKKVILGVNLRKNATSKEDNIGGVVTDKKVNHLEASGNWRKISAVVWKRSVQENGSKIIFEKTVEPSIGYYANKDSALEGVVEVHRNDDFLGFECETLLEAPNGTEKSLIPKGYKVEVLDKSGEWFKVKAAKIWHKDVDSDSQIVYIQKDEIVEGWCKNTDTQFDGYTKVKYGSIESVSIPVRAGDVIGCSGKYQSAEGRLLAGYSGAHVEVFSNDDVPAFLKELKKLATSQNEVYTVEEVKQVLTTAKNTVISCFDYVMDFLFGKGECVCKKYDLIWGAKVSCEFRKKVVQIAKNLNLPQEKFEGANWLMAVMALETGRTFNPAIQNSLGYTGLIQFGKMVAQDLGTTTAKLKLMTDLEQLEYVEEYLAKYKSKLVTLTDIYLSILYPKACGYGSQRDHVVLIGKAYTANPSFFKEQGEDGSNSDGKTYVWEIASVIQAFYDEGQKNKVIKFKCNNVVSNKDEVEEIQIIFDAGVKKDKVSVSSLNTLKKIAKASNNPKVYITSVVRSAREQAEIMYSQTVKYGTEKQYKLYGTYGDQIIRVYETEIKKGSTSTTIIDEMEKKINEIGPSKVSNHCGDYTVKNVFDVSASRLNNPKDFLAEANKLVGTEVAKLLNESDRSCYHFEIKQ